MGWGSLGFWEGSLSTAYLKATRSRSSEGKNRLVVRYLYGKKGRYVQSIGASLWQHGIPASFVILFF